jgi:hypothetical protein
MSDIQKRSQDEVDPRPDWNISKTSIPANAVGVIVTLASAGIFLGVPGAKWFLGASLLLGLVVTLILRFTARDR